ncbi:MAG: nickel-dependent lactate racemase [Anaerolineae bacterium]|nr:nickel-dependent lactate racemase [Thermoflexales bacterium]MDW8408304.1 nickel-dependent lactate racemase [Anaerolineae bacterium]
MKIKLAYGKNGLWIDVPAEWNPTVIEPMYVPGLADPVQAIREAMRPLHHIDSLHNRRIGIIFSDITRPTPNHIILPAVLAELAELGVRREQITLFNALGTHRPNTDAELCAMLGEEIVREYPIIQNNAFDPSTQVCLGVSRWGHEIWINRALVECDLKILTGFIEPHFFAGFSGGGKAIMPGMAGLKTVLGNHDAGMIGHPKATWGVTHGNPIWEEAREAALKTCETSANACLFLLNVSLNKDKQITGVFAGNLDEAHARGCAFVRQTAMRPAPHLFDIVVTTNSGYPLDLNLYQTVKGMSAAAQIVKPGGAIIAVAECWDGIPDHGLYGRLLRESSSPQELLERILSFPQPVQDQWEAHIQALVQLKADVYLRSDGLSDDQIRAALLKPCSRIEDTLIELRKRYGTNATLCILPEGPQTVAYVSKD